MRYLAILISVLMLAACETAQQREAYSAIKADCRMQGYLPGTVEFDDCFKVGKHNYDMAVMQQQLMQMQYFSTMGAAWSPPPAAPMAPAAPARSSTFCQNYGTYIYCY